MRNLLSYYCSKSGLICINFPDSLHRVLNGEASLGKVACGISLSLAHHLGHLLGPKSGAICLVYGQKVNIGVNFYLTGYATGEETRESCCLGLDSHNGQPLEIGREGKEVHGLKEILRLVGDAIENDAILYAKGLRLGSHGLLQVALTNEQKADVGVLGTEGGKGFEEKGVVLLIGKSTYVTNDHLCCEPQLLANSRAHLGFVSKPTEVDAIGHHKNALLIYIGIHPLGCQFGTGEKMCANEAKPPLTNKVEELFECSVIAINPIGMGMEHEFAAASRASC